MTVAGITTQRGSRSKHARDGGAANHIKAVLELSRVWMHLKEQGSAPASAKKPFGKRGSFPKN